MNRFAAELMLLAQSDRWKEMGRDFRADHSKLDPTLLIACVVVLILVLAFLWGLSRVMNRQEGPRTYNNPKDLFLALCRAHELTGRDRRLLLKIARLQKSPQPASLFVEPDRFTTARESTELCGRRAQIDQLNQRLFHGASKD